MTVNAQDSPVTAPEKHNFCPTAALPTPETGKDDVEFAPPIQIREDTFSPFFRFNSARSPSNDPRPGVGTVPVPLSHVVYWLLLCPI